jgi:hypothetical protein
MEFNDETICDIQSTMLLEIQTAMDTLCDGLREACKAEDDDKINLLGDQWQSLYTIKKMLLEEKDDA